MKGNYRENQCPVWNRIEDSWWQNNKLNPWDDYKTKDFEHSVRDAYLIGINAADKFIYLENQWVADDAIWRLCAKKSKQKRDENDPNFRIIIVIPKKFLGLQVLVVIKT